MSLVMMSHSSTLLVCFMPYLSHPHRVLGEVFLMQLAPYPQINSLESCRRSCPCLRAVTMDGWGHCCFRYARVGPVSNH
jgi:hypothetical protein